MAGRQHNPLECSSISRYVWLWRFWTLYVPGFSFPSTKMDIGSSDEEVNMAAGNSVALGLPRGSHTPYICTCPAFSRPSMCTGWNQIDASNAHHCLLLAVCIQAAVKRAPVATPGINHVYGNALIGHLTPGYSSSIRLYGQGTMRFRTRRSMTLSTRVGNSFV